MTHGMIVWGTGSVGKAVLRNLLDYPAYEIAAVIVHTLDKDGRDLGEILGTDTTGIVVTRDVDAAFALEADAVAYFGPSMLHAEDNMRNLCAALRVGKNVVETTMGAFQNPRRPPPRAARSRCVSFR